MPRMCARCGKVLIDPKTGEPDMRRFFCNENDGQCAREDRREKMQLKRKKQKKETSCATCKKLAQPLLVNLGTKTVTLLTPEEALRLAAKQPEILVKFSLQPPEDYDPDRPALTAPLADVKSIRSARRRGENK